MDRSEARLIPWTGSRSAPEPAGDEFAALCEQSYSAVLRYIMGRVHDAGIAEDLTIETFERAHGSWHRFEGRSSATTWLLGIARHVVADHRRTPRLHEVSLQGARADFADTRTLPPEQAALRRDEMARLDRALRSLTDADQELLALRYGADLSMAEVARAVRLGEMAVRVRLFRIRRRLRALLARMEGE